MSIVYPDPVIDEVRAERARISELCQNDPILLVAYFQKLEQQYRGRLLDTSPQVMPAIPDTTPNEIAPTPNQHMR